MNMDHQDDNKGIVALLEGADLADDVKLQVSTLFEAAVNSKVANIALELNENANARVVDKTKEISSAVMEAADTFMTESIRTWLDENKVANADAKKLQRAEKLFEAVSTALSECSLEFTASAEAEIASLNESIGALTASGEETTRLLNEAIAENEVLKQRIATYALNEAFAELSHGLTLTQTSKLKELSESVYCESVDEYKQKVGALKAALFTESKKPSEKVINDLTDVKVDTITESVAAPKKEADQPNSTASRWASYL